MTRLRYNGISGVVDDNPLAAAATAFTSDGLEDLPTIAAPDIVVVIFDPEKQEAQGIEIAYITDHTNGSNTATIDRGEEGTTGKEWPANTRWIHGPTVLDHDAESFPIGTIQMYSGTSAPSGGWLLCAGQAVSRTTYVDLFDVVGTAFGVGDGSTTFNVPDLRGRVAIALDNLGGTSANRITDAAADTLGGSGGAETVTLTASETGVPTHGHADTFSVDTDAHTHDVTGSTASDSHVHDVTGTSGSDSHTHNIDFHYRDTTTATGGAIRVTDIEGVTGNGGTSATPDLDPDNTHDHGAGTFAAATDAHSHTDGTLAAASDTHGHTLAGAVTNHAGTAATAHTNKQPYIALGYIIKAGVF